VEDPSGFGKPQGSKREWVAWMSLVGSCCGGWRG
jgi:hypothetical protein